MNRLNGKRLLLLGGSLWKDSIQAYAKKNGIVLIATGNDSSAGIFQISTENYKIDSTDAEAMKKLIADHHIDGVYMGGSEAVISAASNYLNEIGMPCYCTKAQWNFLENKANFKSLCMKHGIPVAKRYHLSSKTFQEDISEIKFPVITKPQDGCGSNGFSVNYTEQDLRRGYEIAQAASPTGNVLCEEFVNNKSIVVFYTFSKGRMYFSGLEDKFPVRYEQQGSYVAGAHVFESGLVQEFRDLFENKLKYLFDEIGINEGTIWIEVFHDGDKYYFNEVGYRYSGSVSIFPVDYFYQINQVAADINYALLGDSMIGVKTAYEPLIASDKNRKKKYCIYSVHIQAGTIANIIGIDALKKNRNVIAIPFTKTVGSCVLATGTVGQVAAFVHFVFDDAYEFSSMVEMIHSTVKILDENSNNMIQRMVNVDEIIKSIYKR